MERAKSHGVPSALPPESTDSHEPDPASGQKEEEKSIFQKIFGR
jgi:hypothetical protein